MIRGVCLTLLASVMAAAPARAQYVRIQSVEVSPLIGVRMGGTFEIQPDGAEQVDASLPILVEPSVSGFACSTAGLGGCLVLLNGRLVQQFQLSIGPVVRF